MEGHSTTGYFLDYRLLAMPLDSWHQQQREISINISLKNKKPWKVYVQMLFYQMWNLEVNFYCIRYCLILFIIVFALLCSTWWFGGVEILKSGDISVSVSFGWNVQYCNIIYWSFNFHQRKMKKCLKTILRSTSEEILRAQVSNEFHILFNNSNHNLICPSVFVQWTYWKKKKEEKKLIYLSTLLADLSEQTWHKTWIIIK